MRYGDTAEPETIGALILRVRDEHGISQLRLAERLCASAGVTTVTRNEISRWERGERIPSGFWLGWLAVALELPRARLERAAALARRRRSAAVQAARHRALPGPAGAPTGAGAAAAAEHAGLVIPPNWVEIAAGVYGRRAS